MGGHIGSSHLTPLFPPHLDSPVHSAPLGAFLKPPSAFIPLCHPPAPRSTPYHWNLQPPHFPEIQRGQQKPRHWTPTQQDKARCQHLESPSSQAQMPRHQCETSRQPRPPAPTRTQDPTAHRRPWGRQESGSTRHGNMDSSYYKHTQDIRKGMRKHRNEIWEITVQWNGINCSRHESRNRLTKENPNWNEVLLSFLAYYYPPQTVLHSGSFLLVHHSLQ